MPIYLMSIRVLLSVELCVTLKTYLKGAPFYNAWETNKPQRGERTVLALPRNLHFPSLKTCDSTARHSARSFHSTPASDTVQCKSSSTPRSLPAARIQPPFRPDRPLPAQGR